MNRNTNKWAVEVASPNISEAVQRIAFSYGYRWPVGPSAGEKVAHINAKYLVFNPEDKRITYTTNREDVELYVTTIVTSFDRLVEMFINPPSKVLSVGGATVNVAGDVTINEACVMSGEAFDELVVKRAEFLGKEAPVTTMPRVVFMYKSPSSGTRARSVLVTVWTPGEGLEGLDEDDGYRYKAFKGDRIVGTVKFDGYGARGK